MNNFTYMLLGAKNAFSEVVQLKPDRRLGNSDVSQDALKNDNGQEI